MASDGANIIAVDICDQIASVPYPMATPDDLAQTVKLVEDTGARIVAREADVRDHSALNAALQAGVDEFGRLDIVIANAGIAPMQSGEEGWRDVIDVNLTGAFTPSKSRSRRWSNKGDGGAIVLISSAAGLVRMNGGDPGATRLHRRQARHRRADAAYANTLHRTASGSTPFIQPRVNTPMIDNELRQKLARAHHQGERGACRFRQCDCQCRR